MNQSVKCIVCDGSGDCPDHNEVYIREDITLPCNNCVNRKCPVCNGTGQITQEYLTYLSNPTLDPRG